ncbi:MAG: helix-hairpin-helix domain-containing protein [Saprospiraceae bacterium]
MMATKKAKVETTTINFSNSIEKIKESAKTVNTEVVDTTVEVLEDLKTNGEKIREVATAKVKEAIENVTVDNSVKLVKDTAKGIHQYNIETAEEIIEATVDGTKALQNFIAKSLKNGVDFWGQQQNITLTALEDLKKQYGTPEFKFKLKDLFNFDFSFSGGAAVSKEVAKKAAKTVKAKKATAKKVVAKVAKPTTKKAVAKKVTAKTTKPATKKVATKLTAKVTKPATKKVVKKTAAKKVTAAATKNNLRTIEGIGPKIEGLLNAGGIFTFQQLADAPQATLKAILAAAGPRYKMHNPATWNQQSALAAAGKTVELAKLQDELKGGRVAK